MLGAGKAVLTADEVIALLKRTQLPTLITEGSDDYFIFRRIEERFAHQAVSVMAVGGRECVLSVFDRRSELPGNVRVGFIADRDIWIYGETPGQYVHDDLVLSDGYSIENDLYRDGRIEDLLTSVEAEVFQSELREFTKWYSFALSCKMGGQNERISRHPDTVLENGRLNATWAEKIAEDGADLELYTYILEDYPRVMRGKSLMELILRRLSHSKRATQHSRKALLEIASVRGGPHMTAAAERIGRIFGA